MIGEVEMSCRFPIRRLGLMVVLVGGGDASACCSRAQDDRWFGTELGAVVAAADRYNPPSIAEDREFMGAVLEMDGCFTFTVSRGRRGADRIVSRVRVPRGADIVAFWHTHGNREKQNRYFSRIDTELVSRWNKRFYLADYTGFLKVLEPGAPSMSAFEARQLGLPARTGMAYGAVARWGNGEPIRIAHRRDALPHAGGRVGEVAHGVQIEVGGDPIC